ncbi:Peroxidase [Zostera marina]|uniref:Peroxidase n=1 Tax=Zostera marina TaxID=29655 RepID=A0A0K9NRP6_ZOSMR|nr:Peroxidase [Zostera marina]
MLAILLLLLLICLHHSMVSAFSSLTPGFYSETCPSAESIVREVIHRNIRKDPRSAASVMRLQFHDCFVNGCDGSVLLDDTPTMLGEKNSLSNINSLRSYHVIDEVKEVLEMGCPGVVSCADIIVMAARDAVVLSGGPSWEVKLGRKDCLRASQEDANVIMPSPRQNAPNLIELFRTFNLSVTDLVALSGSHTIGYGRCFSVMHRLYNQSDTGQPDDHMDEKYRDMLDGVCPINGDENVTCGLDGTPFDFDNRYFKDLAQLKGFLNSDQDLFSGKVDDTKELVRKFAENEEDFFRAFAEGMVKMGDLQSGKPTGHRKNCRVINKNEAFIFKNYHHGRFILQT